MSLILGIRFLTGYCVAAQSKTDPLPEWPPHPARVFMALAAAHFECEEGEAEREALGWLESLDAPQIRIGRELKLESVGKRALSAIPTFVPMNDSRAVGRGGSIQPIPALKRHRTERLFPRTYLPEGQDTVFLSWPDAVPADVLRHTPALRRLCAAVARIGHSSSLVQVWLPFSAPDDLHTLVPDDRSPQKLRVVARTSGTLDRLRTAFETPPHRAEIKSAQGYREAKSIEPSVAKSVFDDRLELFAMRSDGGPFRWLQLESTLALTRTLREAILERCPIQPPPESIGGHTADGSPSQLPHVAIIPVPFVGNQYADGHLLGVGIVLPRQMSDGDQQGLFAAIDAIVDDQTWNDDPRLGAGLGFDARKFPGLGQWRLIRQGIFDDISVNLHVDRWTAGRDGSCCWASVTPVVFDQHGKSRSKAAYLDECVANIAEAASRVVTDVRIERVSVTAISPIAGVPPAYSFPRLRRKDGSERRHTHIMIEFDQPVVGPILIGAGRYRGYGLLRPLQGRNQ